jgi:TonB family protein
MELSLQDQRDLRQARIASLILHAILLVFLSFSFISHQPGKQVLLTVETIPGYTPQGQGSGAAGNTPQVNDTPANANPLAAGLKLKMDEASAPVKQTKVKVRASAIKPPSAADLSKAYEKLKLGIDPRQGRQSDELSEGGMGNQIKAGTEDGIPGLSAAAGGRGYTPVDLSYPGSIPEESENAILFTVDPQGQVVDARLERTSGYAALDEHILGRARMIRFAPLPASVPQDMQTVRLPVSFKFNGSVLSGGAPSH